MVVFSRFVSLCEHTIVIVRFAKKFCRVLQGRNIPTISFVGIVLKTPAASLAFFTLPN
jgi:hypothetical protein